MNCKICGNPISVDEKGYYAEKNNKRHGICDACWKREEEEIIESEESTKTTFIKIVNILQLIGFIVIAIIDWSNEETLQGFIYIGIGLVIFAFIKGFIDIINLLDNINNKIGN